MLSFSLTYNNKTYTNADLQLITAVAEYYQHGKFPAQKVAECYDALQQIGLGDDFLSTAERELETETEESRVAELGDFLDQHCSGLDRPITKQRLRQLKPDALVDVKQLIGFERIRSTLDCDYPDLVADLTSSNSVIAGGYAMINCIDIGSEAETSDIDVWIYGANAIERRGAFDRLEKRLLRVGGVAGLRGTSVVTFSLPQYGRNVQVILTGSRSPLEVIQSFDLDASRAYLQQTAEGIDCLALPEALLAWEDRAIKRATVINPVRLEKMKRRGFTVELDYNPPSEADLTEALNRNYAHNPAAPWSQTKYCMTKILGCSHVWSLEHLEDRRFSYQELYGIHGLNVGYETAGLKLVPADQYFKLTATVATTGTRPDGSVRVGLVDFQLPTDLADVDHGHLLYDNFNRKNLLFGRKVLHLTLRRGLTAPKEGRYVVGIHYTGVLLLADATVPLYRISALTPSQ